MEGTPPEIDMTLLERQLMTIPGVIAVHDVHVWTVTSGLTAMSGHIVIADVSGAGATLAAARERMKAQFQIDHATIQIETEESAAIEIPDRF